MKQLIFHIGQDRYGLRLHDVLRVLPLVELKQLPLAPPEVAGLMDLHGAPVPVIDLARLSGLPPSAPHFDTRIVLVAYRAPDGRSHPLGLLAERVAGVREVRDDKLADAGVLAAPFLGPVASDDAGMVQLVGLEQLLPAGLRALLFQAPPPLEGDAG
ncbi:chemotaxis protein CheW [Oxalobacteraceae bacterium A2-2]